MQITITLKPEARAQACAAPELRGIPVADDWFGPVFEDAHTVHPSFNPDLFFGIALNDESGTEYFYPYSDIARIKFV